MMGIIGDVAGAALGGLGGAVAGSQVPDYSGIADKYNQQLSQLAQNLNPYIAAGQRGQQQAIALAQQQMQHPAALENQLATGFVASPYQQQMQRNLANMMNYNAANTGMLGSTAANAALQNQLANMQNQWMQQYIDRGTQMYGLGSGDINRTYDLMQQQGFAGQQLADQLRAQGLMAAMEGQMMPTQRQSAITGGLGGAMSGITSLASDIGGLF